MNKEGLLYFHQGWTDIINCLALINYYVKLYDKIYLIVRNDSKNIIDFYCKSINNIQILYVNKHIVDNCYNGNPNIIDYIHNDYSITNNINIQRSSKLEYLFHGQLDKDRTDSYKNIFCNNVNSQQMHFVRKFYEDYNIPYINRINLFEFERNYELEEIKYNDFINKYGLNYILHHEINEKNNDKNNCIINLNGISDVFFDMIKILENSKEIHLLDSVWGAFIYLLDAKYNLFKNKNIKIYLYAKRGYGIMFKEPLLLENWNFI